MDERLRELGRRMRADEARYLDYHEIEERSRSIGVPTSERTLRFYVTEGVLPPPVRRGGKTPVYEEDWILDVLLRIHALKRQGKSLAEIGAALRDGGPSMPFDELRGDLSPEPQAGSAAQPSPRGSVAPCNTPFFQSIKIA